LPKTGKKGINGREIKEKEKEGQEKKNNNKTNQFSSLSEEDTKII